MNNALFLLHVDSGYAVLLAKGFSDGFDTPSSALSEKINTLFTKISGYVLDTGGSENNLALFMEDNTGAPYAISDWCFDNAYQQPDIDGLYRLKQPEVIK